MNPIFIFNADDYGENRETNRAIESVVYAGLVRAVSVIGCERAHYGRLREEKGDGIRWGAHLYATVFPPLTRSLRARCGVAGVFTKRCLFQALVAGDVSESDLQEEFEEQIRRLKDAGFYLSFLDTHQNIHSWPIVHRVVQRLAESHLVVPEIRPVIQLSFTGGWRATGILSELIGLWYGHSLDDRVVVDCPGYNKVFVDIHQVQSQWEEFLRRVSKRGYRKLIVPVHPGMSPAEIQIYSDKKIVSVISRFL